MTEIDVLGVRHHGPGSARSVAGALADIWPDLVIIEGPPELDQLIPLAADPELVPPVSALVYVTDEPRGAAFYPFARFSPEWVALRWALQNGVDVRFADLPAAHDLALHDQEDRRGSGDPIGFLAEVAGYDDPERWWEDAIEHRNTSSLERFRLLREAMTVVREEHPEIVHDRIERREAAMRKIIRAELKVRARIAVVCGAAHAPVLHPDSFPTAAADNKLLTKLPKVRVRATWAPWTAQRLSIASGYGAGVTAPGWYQHLFDCWTQGRSDEVVPGWLTRVARTLRDDGLDAAPASVVEAVRLAEMLAAVRGRPSVGLTEVTHATQTVLCNGSALPLQLINNSLVVGEELGQVPESAPLVPLAQDLAALQRRLRLKPSAAETTVLLDLRKESQLERSLLLHRLRLLGIDWGRPTDAGGTTGTFKEAWRLQWQPEFAVDLVEAGLYGTTVLEAAENLLIERSSQDADLETLSDLADQALTAELPRGLAAVITALGAQTAHQHDALTLLRSVEPLARTQRYSDVRRADTSVVAGILHTVVTRAAVGLRPASIGLDDDAAERLRDAVDSANRGVNLTHVGLGEWRPALQQVATDDRVHGLISGRVNRILLDADQVDRQTIALRLSRRLSPGAEPLAGAAWLDGFLDSDPVLLLHDRDLLRLIDTWIDTVDDTIFDDLVPLLRRTFARFEPAARRRLGNRLQRLDDHDQPTAGTPVEFDLDRARPAIARVAELLGLEAS